MCWKYFNLLIQFCQIWWISAELLEQFGITGYCTAAPAQAQRHLLMIKKWFPFKLKRKDHSGILQIIFKEKYT